MTRRIIYLYLILLMAVCASAQKAGDVITAPAEQQQSQYFTIQKLTDEVIARMKGKSLPADRIGWGRENLRYVRVLHCNRDGKTQVGEIVCNRSVADDFLDIFRKLYKAKYCIERMVLVDEYDADDERSMDDNNTSCFNYRCVPGTKTLSKHSLGLAIDVNPFYNPYITKSGVSPKGGKPWAYNRAKLKAPVPIITTTDLCYKLFIQHGFRWGGAWRSSKDYQHFDKAK